MKVLITENKLEKVVQKLINYHLENLKKIKEEDEDNIPDDISEGTWEDIHTVEKITIEDSRTTQFKSIPEQVHIFTLGITYDSVTGIDVSDILYDLQSLCRETLRIPLHFNLGEEINRYKEYGQW